MALAATPAAAQTGDAGFVHDRADQAFLVAMIADGRAELALAETASRASADARVRQWAATVSAAHTVANRDLTAMAHAKDIHAPDGLDPSHQAMRDGLTPLEGIAFDVAFLDAMARLHAAQIDLLEHEASDGLDAEL